MHLHHSNGTWDLKHLPDGPGPGYVATKRSCQEKLGLIYTTEKVQCHSVVSLLELEKASPNLCVTIPGLPADQEVPAQLQSVQNMTH